MRLYSNDVEINSSFWFQAKDFGKEEDSCEKYKGLREDRSIKGYGAE